MFLECFRNNLSDSESYLKHQKQLQIIQFNKQKLTNVFFILFIC